MWCVWLRIIKALLTVQISPISTFLCGICKRTEIWFLSDTLTGRDPSANGPRGEHDYVSVGAEQKKGVNDGLRLCAASRTVRPMVQTRPDALLPLLFPQTRKKLGVTGTFSGVLMRPIPHFSQHLRIPLWRKTSPDDARLERRRQLDELRGSGWVTGSLAFGGSHLTPSHLYSLCFLEHIRALRFTQLLYLIEFNLRWLWNLKSWCWSLSRQSELLDSLS